MKRFGISKIRIVFLTAFAVLINSTYAINPQKPADLDASWKTLQKAQSAFDRADYSKSMSLLTDCLSQRKKEVEYIDFVLSNSLKPYQVRRVGDAIDDVLKVLNERQEYETVSIINKWVELKGKDFFNDSIKELRDYLLTRIDYPEAYFLIAKIYKIEGEFDMALNYLEKARKNASLLEIPAQSIEIFYEIADIAEYKGDTVEQEKALLMIAANDGRFKDAGLKNAILRTSKSEKEDNSSRFFSLYRIDAIATLKAYLKLSEIFAQRKNYEDAYITNAYAVLIAFTHINSILEEREPDYSYENLSQFFKEIERYPDVLRWCNENSLWKGFYNFYDYGLKLKFIKMPVCMAKVLSTSCPNQYYKNAAKTQIEKINTQKEIVLPDSGAIENLPSVE